LAVWRRGLAMVAAGLMLAAGVMITRAHGAPAREGNDLELQQPTAVPLQFPTPTATAGPPTETPTRTPTALGRAVVEAISVDTNVRAGPDINENRVGQIQPGTQYPVLGNGSTGSRSSIRIRLPGRRGFTLKS